MPSTFLLDESGDLALGEYADGTQSLFIARGKEQVAQAASQAVSLKRGSVWFNLAAGIDYDGLFYNSGRSDANMEAIRATILREEILSVPGIEGFAGDDLITFERNGRTLKPVIPCVLIDCENSITSSFIGVL